MKRIYMLAALLLATGCASKQERRTVAPMRVETLVVAPSSETESSRYVGTIEEERSVALSFPRAGTLARIEVDEGEYVTRGAVVAELDPTSARQSYAAAEATFEQARDACERLRKLHEANSLPEIQWVEAQTRLQQASSTFELARKNLEDCTLRAPFAGVVGKRQAEAGETLLPGVPVVTLLDIASVKVRFAVPEQEIASLDARRRIDVSVAALGDQTFRAGAPRRSIEANPAAHTYEVTAPLGNADRRLLPGMVCRVTTSPADAAEELVVPLQAVREAGDGSRFVWKVAGDSVLRTPVRTGRFAGNAVVIEEGLSAGDRIVTEGMQKIGEGSKIVWE